MIQNDLNDVIGPLELAVVGTKAHKGNIRKVRDMVLKNCFDAAQVRGDSPGFFVKQVLYTPNFVDKRLENGDRINSGL